MNIASHHPEIPVKRTPSPQTSMQSPGICDGAFWLVTRIIVKGVLLSLD